MQAPDIGCMELMNIRCLLRETETILNVEGQIICFLICLHSDGGILQLQFSCQRDGKVNTDITPLLNRRCADVWNSHSTSVFFSSCDQADYGVVDGSYGDTIHMSHTVLISRCRTFPYNLNKLRRRKYSHKVGNEKACKNSKSYIGTPEHLNHILYQYMVSGCATESWIYKGAVKKKEHVNLSEINCSLKRKAPPNTPWSHELVK
jgi:hypothetical protein